MPLFDPSAVLESSLLWGLVALQIAMGGFDIIFHHELTERLAWRDNAAHELKLHGLRNLFYAVLFSLFAWVQPHGVFAFAVMAILAGEIVITLKDFVEEDRTRLLPPTERVLHTLLAINYGAILVLIMPVLAAWAQLNTALEAVSYGLGSAILTVAGAGCLLLALRDFSTSRRARRFLPEMPVDLGADFDRPQHVLITGGTGLIGRRLVQSLTAAGHDVTVLTRDVARAKGLVAPVRLVTDLDQIDRNAWIDAIVDLAGEPVAGGLWTRSRRREILLSRLEMSRTVNRFAARLLVPPRVIVTASAIGAYGLTGDERLSEGDTGATPRAFTRRVCEARERMAMRAERLGIRVVRLRIGLVLDRDGGLLSRLVAPFDLGLGGRIGSGRQWMSWIALPDLVRLIAFVIKTPELAGPVNATAPSPVRNSEFAMALGRILNRPAVLPLPGLLLELALGDFARELFLGGQRVLPTRVTAAGFRFRTPKIEAGLAAGLRLAPALKHPVAATHRSGPAAAEPAMEPKV